MKLEDFNYNLPKDLIAQEPSKKRDESRLMILNRQNNTIEHKHFFDIIEYLNEGDCLCLNDSRVIPARIFAKKEITGANIELLLIKRIDGDIWEVMVRPGKKLKNGNRVLISEKHNFYGEVLGYADEKNGTRKIKFEYDGIFMEVIEEVGAMPLPPYIEREADSVDKERYQTVYNHIEGSVAAPTAGLHFTNELLNKIEQKGVKIAYLTLHVGIGTFRPVKCENIEEHEMHFEEFTISTESANIINETIRGGGRIISVGTTSTRTLESSFVEIGDKYYVKPQNGNTGIFIYPGYKFKIVDALITNFHLPESTLIMLISAFYDREKILSAYKEAVEKKYRFFSYGDAMLIE